MIIILPKIFIIDELTNSKNLIQQLGERELQLEGGLIPFTRERLRGFLFQPNYGGKEILILPPKTKQVPDGYERILLADANTSAKILDLSNGMWLKHPLLHAHQGEINYPEEIRKVHESWVDAFSYVREEPERSILGLRNPQIGALHAIHAHWTVSDAPATIVMPTGTGKTETMLSVLVSERCSKLLVVVPTDALRTQLALKFLTLGILKLSDSSILHTTANYPVVCILKHIPKTVGEVDDVFGRAQVIIATSSIMGQCEDAVQERIARNCSYLFIDEAHHIEAPTWNAFKEKFKHRKILQFTATPFREDGKPLDGDIIYKYPLKKAQEEGYFTQINFKPIIAFDRKTSDEIIAETAIEQLQIDRDKGHVLMARVDSVKRAQEVYEIYSKYSEFNPVQLHTGIKSQSKRDEIRRNIITGKTRIVVCVDMLGEGFDLPELKIAAFHDIKKSLAVTLQLAGRFTRTRPDLGNATFIANTGDVSVQDELSKLYTRDPDWNLLLPQLSDSMIGEQVSLQEFLRGFTEFTKEIPLKTIRPATSMVVYKTTCDSWSPRNFKAGIPAINTCDQVYATVNQAKHTLIIVTARRVALAWTEVANLFSWDWELHIVIWSPDKKLLYINSSTNTGEYRALAQAVAGETVTLIKGNEVFRSFFGVNRLCLQNVGLTEQLGRNVRYTGRMGADVESGLSELQKRHALKSVLSGCGYEDGTRVTVGASRKGRIWSHQRGRIGQLVAWCEKIGTKLLDAAIEPDEILKGTLEPERLSERPNKMPICVDWPEEIYLSLESIWSVVIREHQYLLSELSMEIVAPKLTGQLRIAITSDTDRVELELMFLNENEELDYRFAVVGDVEVKIRRGGERVQSENMTDYFYNNPPVVWFSDGSSLEGNQYVKLKNAHPPYNVNNIQAWEWPGINIRKESQGKMKESDSIQARVINELRLKDYHMVVDDDGKGEAADIVAIKIEGEKKKPSRIAVDFYHCKYSQEATPGQRIEDLYEVLGQAQKSIYWMSSPEKRTDLFTHLMRREARRQNTGAPSRYELGDGELLRTIREMSHVCPVSLSVYIVQPGLSKANVTQDQLALLSVTENYLMETYQLPFGVIASP